MSEFTFPHSDTLCEDCGYALKGLQASGDCPECGKSIQASSPGVRTGPRWQARPGAQAGFKIVIALMLNPRYFFRTMRVDGGNGYARLFLWLTAVAIGAGWWLGAWWAYGMGPVSAVWPAGIVAGSVVVLSYIETVGVMFFSRRRGWRVPMRLAERIVCYSSIAWVPAAGVMGLALVLYDRGYIDRWMTGLLGTWEPWQTLGLLVLVGAVAMLWFEFLVWVGVRQTKYANAYPAGGGGGAGVEHSAAGVET